MITDIVSISIEAGLGGVLGLVTGYTSKKLVKLVAAVLGVYLISRVFVQDGRVIAIRWGSLAQVVAALYSGWLVHRPLLATVGVLSSGGSFVISLLVGFNRGRLW